MILRERLGSVRLSSKSEKTVADLAIAQPVVVLIHGLAAHRALMIPLSRFLYRHKFATHRYGYRSLLSSIEQHAAQFRDFLDRLNNSESVSEIHIVAHSLGCIVTRAALLESSPTKLNRIVMLAPPNAGSATAEFLSRRLIPFCKTLRQLSNSETSFVNGLPQPRGLEIGVVAAWYDHVVSRKSSHLEDASDEVVVFSGHNGLLVRPASFRQVLKFLQTGRFAEV